MLNDTPLSTERVRWTTAAFALFLMAGCQQKMADQPSYKPLNPSTFFPDGQSARPLVPGTVARGHLRLDAAFYTGKTSSDNREWVRPAAIVGAASGGPIRAAAIAAAEQDNYVNDFPVTITPNVVKHGQHRFMIYCAVCHDALGTGRGKIVERGYTAPPTYHIDRLRNAPVGYIFDVITLGYGSMPSYASQIPVRDRWAIVAYVRALQVSQHFPVDRLTETMRRERETAKPIPGERAQP